VLNQQLREAFAAVPGTFRFMPADISRKTGILLLNFLLTAQANLICVDHDDEITCINVRGKDSLSFPAQDICHGHSHTA
jgi:hypothetical protein